MSQQALWSGLLEGHLKLLCVFKKQVKNLAFDFLSNKDQSKFKNHQHIYRKCWFTLQSIKKYSWYRDTVPLTDYLWQVSTQRRRYWTTTNTVREATTDERVQIDWQRPLSGLHSIVMVHSAQPGEGGGCTTFLFYSIYHHEQNIVAVYAPAGRVDTLLLFLLCGGDCLNLTVGQRQRTIYCRKQSKSLCITYP